MKFKDLEIGQRFWEGNDLMVKVPDSQTLSDDVYFNAVCLNKGYVEMYSPTCPIERKDEY